ncbi:LacI family DNA-binding transcriptional regulator [Actinomadura gamaensis]|uniref:LacI family DNA-binding transcriptional regulator n=1 Tax=Actinomadura gamaensis TaxID=1763541 RepID=A0ABV9TWI8_9ACTN
MPYPTLEDVAARAGVSRALVSLVMRGSPKVGAARRAAVLAAARDLGYRPNAMARSLAAGRTGIVGVLAGDLADPAVALVHDGLADAAEGRELRLLLAAGRGDTAAARTALDELLDLRPDGLVLAGPRLTSADLDRAAASCPVVVIDPVPRAGLADAVRSASGETVRLAVSHLVGLGHRRIATVHAGPRRPLTHRAYRSALQKHGIDALALGIDDLQSVLRPESPAGAAEKPTAVVALCDSSGAAVLAALMRAGARVPDDVSLVVHGEATAADAVGVTTVAVPARELGRQAMAALLDRLDGGDPDRRPLRANVHPLLTDRGSTAPVPPAEPDA